jgi:hypothetical protein
MNALSCLMSSHMHESNIDDVVPHSHMAVPLDQIYNLGFIDDKAITGKIYGFIKNNNRDALTCYILSQFSPTRFEAVVHYDKPAGDGDLSMCFDIADHHDSHCIYLDDYLASSEDKWTNVIDLSTYSDGKYQHYRYDDIQLNDTEDEPCYCIYFTVSFTPSDPIICP